jgi:hypothetical protein
MHDGTPCVSAIQSLMAHFDVENDKILQLKSVAVTSSTYVVNVHL